MRKALLLAVSLLALWACNKTSVPAPTPAPDFEPIRSPAPGDWLDQHPEAGQTFEQFVKSKPNLPTKKRRTINFVGIGPFGDKSPDLEMLYDYARIYYGLPVKALAPLTIEEIGVKQRKNPDTGWTQLLAPDVLWALKLRLPSDAYCLVGLTETDLYPEPSWNFVFGQASLKERVAIYSFARYHEEDADESLVKRRAMKVMVHELGHSFGLEHCVFYECVFNGSNHLGETDRRPMHACPVCLKKLQHSLGFDPKTRYESLAAFYEKHGLTAEAAWAQRRAGTPPSSDTSP